jgi:hypothetical protein
MRSKVLATSQLCTVHINKRGGFNENSIIFSALWADRTSAHVAILLMIWHAATTLIAASRIEKSSFDITKIQSLRYVARHHNLYTALFQTAIIIAALHAAMVGVVYVVAPLQLLLALGFKIAPFQFFTLVVATRYNYSTIVSCALLEKWTFQSSVVDVTGIKSYIL